MDPPRDGEEQSRGSSSSSCSKSQTRNMAATSSSSKSKSATSKIDHQTLLTKQMSSREGERPFGFLASATEDLGDEDNKEARTGAASSSCVPGFDKQVAGASSRAGGNSGHVGGGKRPKKPEDNSPADEDELWQSSDTWKFGEIGVLQSAKKKFAVTTSESVALPGASAEMETQAIMYLRKETRKLHGKEAAEAGTTHAVTIYVATAVGTVGKRRFCDTLAVSKRDWILRNRKYMGKDHKSPIPHEGAEALRLELDKLDIEELKKEYGHELGRHYEKPITFVFQGLQISLRGNFQLDETLAAAIQPVCACCGSKLNLEEGRHKIVEAETDLGKGHFYFCTGSLCASTTEAFIRNFAGLHFAGYNNGTIAQDAATVAAVCYEAADTGAPAGPGVEETPDKVLSITFELRDALPGQADTTSKAAEDMLLDVDATGSAKSFSSGSAAGHGMTTTAPQTALQALRGTWQEVVHFRKVVKTSVVKDKSTRPAAVVSKKNQPDKAAEVKGTKSPKKNAGKRKDKDGLDESSGDELAAYLCSRIPNEEVDPNELRLLQSFSDNIARIRTTESCLHLQPTFFVSGHAGFLVGASRPPSVKEVRGWDAADALVFARGMQRALNSLHARNVVHGAIGVDSLHLDISRPLRKGEDPRPVLTCASTVQLKGLLRLPEEIASDGAVVDLKKSDIWNLGSSLLGVFLMHQTHRAAEGAIIHFPGLSATAPGIPVAYALPYEPPARTLPLVFASRPHEFSYHSPAIWWQAELFFFDDAKESEFFQAEMHKYAAHIKDMLAASTLPGGNECEDVLEQDRFLQGEDMEVQKLARDMRGLLAVSPSDRRLCVDEI
ncbi:unnamed protein product [Amoebophrya sp. A120]|nr:unnamed protein product [Amoebophrya sp. A120]|eukprot:GSA120T00020764001.1